MKSVSVHSRIVLDKDGARLESFDVRSNRYRNKKYTDKAVENYNSGMEMPKINYGMFDNARRRWYTLYYNMLVALERWRYKNI